MQIATCNQFYFYNLRNFRGKTEFQPSAYAGTLDMVKYFNLCSYAEGNLPNRCDVYHTSIAWAENYEYFFVSLYVKHLLFLQNEWLTQWDIITNCILGKLIICFFQNYLWHNFLSTFPEKRKREKHNIYWEKIVTY